MELCGYAFGRVCEIEPDRTDAGVVEVAVPQPEYAKRDEKAVHDHGWGPFCAFGVPDEGTHRPGVYAIAVEGEVSYVGETQDLYAKFANGYGTISPADCFEGGGGTNCRLNTAIFHAVRAGERVSLHLHATDDFAGADGENRALRRIIKEDLVTALDPAWNRTGGERESDPAAPEAADVPESPATADAETEVADDPTRSDDASEPPRNRPTDEFAPLYDYLAGHERDRVERTFAELEVVLDAPLPMQARRWRQWWTNDETSHPHSGAWLRAGYEVSDVSLPDGRIAFERPDADAADADGAAVAASLERTEPADSADSARLADPESGRTPDELRPPWRSKVRGAGRSGASRRSVRPRGTGRRGA